MLAYIPNKLEIVVAIVAEMISMLTYVYDLKKNIFDDLNERYNFPNNDYQKVIVDFSKQESSNLPIQNLCDPMLGINELKQVYNFCNSTKEEMVKFITKASIYHKNLAEASLKDKSDESYPLIEVDARQKIGDIHTAYVSLMATTNTKDLHLILTTCDKIKFESLMVKMNDALKLHSINFTTVDQKFAFVLSESFITADTAAACAVLKTDQSVEQTGR